MKSLIQLLNILKSLIFLFVFFSFYLSADEGDNQADSNAVENAPSTHDYIIVLDMHLGSIKRDTATSDKSDSVFGFSARLKPESFSPNLQWQFEMFGWGQEFDNTEFTGCFLVCANNNVDVSVGTMSTGLVGVYPADSNWQVYLQGNLYYASIDYTLTGSFLGIPGDVASDDDSKFGFHHGFGLTHISEKHSFGIHVRSFDISSKSTKFAIDKIDLGGDYIGLSFGYHF
ncbi:MAG: hypothetical protein OEY96_06520 [Gammaproteobacteria bacterium]|nr:hypothetical protein [Gammaproteobacteria bacterium]